MTGEPAPDGPLKIDGIALSGGGVIGLTHCPGRSGPDGAGQTWRRDLTADLATMEQWNARIVISLVEGHELARLGVPHLLEEMQARTFAWHHVPISDMRSPDATALADWRAIEPAVADALARGERVVFHCAAGLGRTGTMVARLLVERFGLVPADAIATVREHRPGAIETAEQEAFVASGDARPMAPSK